MSEITDQMHKEASYRGFLNTLRFGGKARIEKSKQADAQGNHKETVVWQPMSEAEVKSVFTKYATEQRPHRDESVRDYYGIITGGKSTVPAAA